MNKKFDITKHELVEVITGRAQSLKRVDWFLPIETEIAIERVQSALDEYRKRVQKFQKENPIKG